MIWPPKILSDRIGPDHSTVVRDYDGADHLAALQRRDVDMRGFTDADLGPGGVYVTRWGRDPIKSGPGPQGWLMPAEAFADLGAAQIDSPYAPMAQRWDAPESADAEVVYVPRATMPIPGGASQAGASGTTMEVALLTYRPRFDADREVWYADIPLSGLGVAEPFVRLGLVRYQPLAPRELRVSEPIVEWAQIMPGRRVVATASSTEKGRITVTVTGPGFLLHDVFGAPLGEVADTLGRKAAAVRQPAGRARRNVQAARPRFPVECERIGGAFFAASTGGDTAALRTILAENAVLHSDGDGRVPAFIDPIGGSDSLPRMFEGVRHKWGQGSAQLLEPVWIDGLPGHVGRDRGGVLQTTALAIEDGRIRRPARVDPRRRRGHHRKE